MLLLTNLLFSGSIIGTWKIITQQNLTTNQTTNYNNDYRRFESNGVTTRFVGQKATNTGSWTLQGNNLIVKQSTSTLNGNLTFTDNNSFVYHYYFYYNGVRTESKTWYQRVIYNNHQTTNNRQQNYQRSNENVYNQTGNQFLYGNNQQYQHNYVSSVIGNWHVYSNYKRSNNQTTQVNWTWSFYQNGSAQFGSSSTATYSMNGTQMSIYYPNGTNVTGNVILKGNLMELHTPTNSYYMQKR